MSSMTTQIAETAGATEPGTRMKSPERRELILQAATRVFGERGYDGARGVPGAGAGP